MWGKPEGLPVNLKVYRLFLLECIYIIIAAGGIGKL